MDHYHDDDYEYFVYSINSIKADLGLTPHTRNGLFERLISQLEEDRKISVLDWRLKNRDGEFVWYRMLSPSDAVTMIVEYYKALPDKKKDKIFEKANDMISTVAFFEGWHETN